MKKNFWIEISPTAVGILLALMGMPLWPIIVLVIGYIIAVPIIAIVGLMNLPPDVKEEVVKPVVDTNSPEYLARFMPKA